MSAPRRPSPIHIIVAAVLAFAAACAGGKSADADALHGVALPTPQARPTFTLTDTWGHPYNFQSQTAGKLTFLFFGYTNCPDVCPVHLANIAAVLHTLTYDDQQKIKVVFVTTDPARDSAQRIRTWLDAFDPSFIGLTGTQAQLDSTQRLLNLAPAVKGPVQPDGSYSVGHAGQVIVFQQDDTARFVYPFGVRQSDWAHDIPLLLHSRSPHV